MKSILIVSIIVVLVGVLIWLNRQSDEETMVYTMVDGAQTDDIRSVSGPAQFKMLGPSSIPAAAEAEHQRGRKLGSQGQYDQALEAFRKASSIAPQWAYPIYDMAFTLQLQGKPVEALAAYRQVDVLEPEGFFTTKTAIWALEREAKATFPSGTYVKYLMLEDIADQQKRRDGAKALFDAVPGFTPALKEYAIKSEDDAERMQLIEQALAMDVDVETKGVLLLNKASCLHAMGRKDESLKLLAELRDDKAETLFTRKSAAEILKAISRN